MKGGVIIVTYYLSNEKTNTLEKVTEITDGVWINMVAPTEAEIIYISSTLNLDEDFIRSALDDNERSHIEIDENTDDKLFVVDVPIIEETKKRNIYNTLPLSIISTKTCIITVALEETMVLDDFTNNRIKTFYTFKKSRFILQILYKNASLFLYYLKLIDKQSSRIEDELYNSMRNKELIQLLSLEKSLVYFSTSLKSNEIMMEKLLRYPFMRKYEDDMELLEDTIIENKQAIEMAKIYSDILTGTMDAFASVISNNLNIVMKLLASITIIMAIPTIIASFFGMNVPVPFESNPFAFWIIVAFAVIICLVVGKYMWKKDMF